MRQIRTKESLDKNLRYIAEAVAAEGGRAYFVGGCVRDKFLGRENKDIDIEIYGIEADKIDAILRRRFRVEVVGKSFGVWILKGCDIDVSMPRRERKVGEGHKAFEIDGDPFMSPVEACRRRDFTINSMLEDILSGEIVDPFGGLEDMRKKILRHTSERFSEDPLRVLRAMQFAARFDFDVAGETVDLCAKIPFENLPMERVFEEWKKMILKGVAISKGLNFLRDCGWVKYFPELCACVGCQQDKQWHPEGDVYAHTGYCMDCFARERVGDEREDLVVGLAVLCHDMGKPLCTTHDPDGHIRSHGHDILGVKPAERFLGRITREKALIAEVLPLVKRHMAILDLWRNKSGDSAIRRLAREVVRIDRLVRVDSADRGGRPPIVPEPSPQGLWILERARILAVQDSAPKPILQGRHLIEMGLKPSPRFSGILSAAYEAQLDGEIFDIDSARDFARKLLENDETLN